MGFPAVRQSRLCLCPHVRDVLPNLASALGLLCDFRQLPGVYFLLQLSIRSAGVLGFDGAGDAVDVVLWEEERWMDQCLVAPMGRHPDLGGVEVCQQLQSCPKNGKGLLWLGELRVMGQRRG